MTVTVNAQKMIDACKFLQSHTINMKLTIPALKCATIQASHGQLTLRASDLDTECTITLDCDGDMPATVLDISKIAALGKVAGDMMLSPNTDSLEVITAARRITTPIEFTLDDYPVVMELQSEYVAFTAPAAQIYGDLTRVAPAMSNEQSRYYLNGVCVDMSGDRTVFAATDGHRLQTISREFTRSGEISGNSYNQMRPIVPAKVVKAILAATKGQNSDAAWTFTHTKTQLLFGNIRIVSKLIDGIFPEYPRVIPAANADASAIQANAKALADALPKLPVKGLQRVILGLGVDVLSVSADHAGYSASIPAEIANSGSLAAIGVNARYLRDFCKGAKGGIILRMDSANHPIRIEYPNVPEFLGALMPIRI